MVGALTAVGVMVAVAAIRADIAYARSGAVFLIAVLIGRIVGFANEGFHDNTAAVILVPCISFAILAVAHLLLNKVEARAVS